MNDIAVVMITVDRTPRQNYLAQTLEYLARSGVFASERLHSFHLINSRSDQFARLALDSAALCHAWAHMPYEEQRTPNENAATALTIGAESGAAWVLFLEDDLDVCAHFLESVGLWLDDHATLQVPVYIFGAGAPGDNMVDLFHRGETCAGYKPENFYGTQAIAMRSSTAYDVAQSIRDQAPHVGDRGYDLLIGRWAVSQGYHAFLASIPSFVQHVGHESALTSGMFLFPSWPGREWTYMAKRARCRSLVMAQGGGL